MIAAKFVVGATTSNARASIRASPTTGPAVRGPAFEVGLTRRLSGAWVGATSLVFSQIQAYARDDMLPSGISRSRGVGDAALKVELPKRTSAFSHHRSSGGLLVVDGHRCARGRDEQRDIGFTCSCRL